MKYKLEVEPFSHDFMQSQGDKALALKPLEEAAEAFGAWQRYEGDEWDDTDRELGQMLRDEIAGELADTVQACVNLADWEGLDLDAALSRVHDRNAERGRHEVRKDCEEVRTCCADDEKPSTGEDERVASALRALEAPDWPSLTRAVLGRNGTRREVVLGLADLILGIERHVCGADGIEIAVGDTVWANGTARGDGGKWEVVGFDHAKEHCVTAENADGDRRDLRPEWLTHTEPDSWEKLETDAGKTACAYFGREGNFVCSTCDHSAGGCLADQARDIVRRAMVLAGVEE